MTEKKRAYDSSKRKQKAEENKLKVLKESRKLFEEKGFKATSLLEIAEASGLAKPTLYALFGSKDGILLEILDHSLSKDSFEQMVTEVNLGKTAWERFQKAAKLSRTLYEAESSTLSLLRGSAALSPEIKNFEKRMEARRYERQKPSIEESFKRGFFKPGLTFQEIRDVIWSLTSRDLYKLFVQERKWSPSRYEKWLAKTLYETIGNTNEKN